MAEEEKDAPTLDGYFREWLKQKRHNLDLQGRIDELEADLLQAQLLLRDSVPRDKAQFVVKSAYNKGQLTGTLGHLDHSRASENHQRPCRHLAAL